ncbi:MAG: glycosyltransferase family 87 protein [Solirubrobacteraceae bacterium]
MREQHNDGERAVSFASAGSSPAERTVTLPTLPRLSGTASLPRIRLGRVAGRIAIGTLIVATLVVVVAAASGPSVLVPRSSDFFPAWEAGPLHVLVPRLIDNPKTVGLAFSAVLVVMIVAYLVAVAAVRALSMRVVVGAIVALHVILLLSPPLQLNDVFNYLGYARLGGLHELNPYTHVIKQEFFDPIYGFTTWHNLRSPYGSLFTALTYPLAFVSIPLAYWCLKLSAVLLSLGFLALVWQCARQLGRDPRYALVFVALNPIYLIYAIGGFHNDFMMLVPSMAAISFLLARRDRLSGAALVLAIAVKFTAVLLAPFLLVALATRQRRLRFVVGAALAAVPMIALSLALFGFSIPNLSDQSSLLTDFSIPNIVGLAIGIGGGAPGLLKVAIVCVVLVVVYEVYRERDWLAGAGWSTFALLASLAWLVPWYVIWLLPLAALATSVNLRRTALAMTVFLILAFMPATALYMAAHGINPLGSSVGQASQSHQHKLAN